MVFFEFLQTWVSRQVVSVEGGSLSQEAVIFEPAEDVIDGLFEERLFFPGRQGL